MYGVSLIQYITIRTCIKTFSTTAMWRIQRWESFCKNFNLSVVMTAIGHSFRHIYFTYAVGKIGGDIRVA